jgi:hypothetical protein
LHPFHGRGGMVTQEISSEAQAPLHFIWMGIPTYQTYCYCKRELIIKKNSPLGGKHSQLELKRDAQKTPTEEAPPTYMAFSDKPLSS